jgi:flagellar motor component MotA
MTLVSGMAYLPALGVIAACLSVFGFMLSAMRLMLEE